MIEFIKPSTVTVYVQHFVVRKTEILLENGTNVAVRLITGN